MINTCFVHHASFVCWDFLDMSVRVFTSAAFEQLRLRFSSHVVLVFVALGCLHMLVLAIVHLPVRCLL